MITIAKRGNYCWELLEDGAVYESYDTQAEAEEARLDLLADENFD